MTRSLVASHAALALAPNASREPLVGRARAVAMPSPSSAAEVLSLLGREPDARSRGEGGSRERARGWRVAVFTAGAHARRRHDFPADGEGGLEPRVRRLRGGSRRARALRSPRLLGVVRWFRNLSPSSERLDVLRSSRGLGPDKRVPHRFLPRDPTRQPRSRSCAPWVWRARRSARATRARSPRGSGARGATARAHPAPATARPAAATPPVPSHRRAPRSSGRTTTPP